MSHNAGLQFSAGFIKLRVAAALGEILCAVLRLHESQNQTTRIR